MNQLNNPVYCTFLDSQEHVYPGHPESPQRFQHMRGWLANPPYPEIAWLDFKPASEADVLLVHNLGMLETLKEACHRGPHEFEPSPSYVTAASYGAALQAAGATLAISRRIMADGRGRGFAIVRPPGHHAEPDRSMGFCLLNNIAIAAADAVASGIGKVAIFDFDAHHGNGTQTIFTNTPEVGFLSIHEEKLFPGSGRLDSAHHARGRIINIPLPAFTNQAAFLSILTEIAAPWLQKFGAEMLLVSAGFDTHFSDPLTTTTLDTRGFHQMSRTLVDLAQEFCHGRILFVLEGGYDPQALSDNIQACLAAMCGRSTFPDHYGPSPGGRSNLTSHLEKLKDLHQLREE